MQSGGTLFFNEDQKSTLEKPSHVDIVILYKLEASNQDQMSILRDAVLTQKLRV